MSALVHCVSCAGGIQGDFLGRVTASIQKTARAVAACGSHSSEWPEKGACAAHTFAAPTATKRILWTLRDQLKDARCSHVDESSRELAVFGTGLFPSCAEGPRSREGMLSAPAREFERKVFFDGCSRCTSDEREPHEHGSRGKGAGRVGQARCTEWFRSCRACIGHRAESLYVYNAYNTNVTYACQVISVRATLPACRRLQLGGNSITLSAFAFLSRRSKRSTERLSASAGSAGVICLKQSGRSLGQTTCAVARFRHTRKPAVPQRERGEFRKNCKTSFIPHSKPSLSAHPPR